MEATLLTAQAFLKHWQGHRRLTRRVIEAFPEDKLFTFSVGGMRPFAGLALEMIGMASTGVRGVASGQWSDTEALAHRSAEGAPATKRDLLDRWDETTRTIDHWWPQIAPARFQEVDKVFNMYETTIYEALLYLMDNEVHHRGQGYVYLRALGIEPPPFWER